MRALTLVFASLVLATPVLAQQPTTVAVTAVWARASAGPAKTAAVYATVTASGPDRLTGASTPAAANAELHQSSMSNGVMQMRPVPGGLPVSPGTPVRLSPGGYHLMLTGLKAPLRQGEQFPITFTFAHAGPVMTEVTVASAGASQPDAAAMPGMK